MDQNLGFSFKFAKINASALQKYYLDLIEQNPELFLD